MYTLGGTALSSSRLAALLPLLSTRQVDLDVVLRAIVDESARQLDADRATFYLVDHAGRCLISRAAHLPEIAEIRLHLGEGVAGWVAAHAQVMRVGEGQDDPRWSGRTDHETGYRTRNVLAAPVVDERGTVIGVLQALNKVRGDFSTHDELRVLEIAKEVAGLLGATSLASQLRPDHRQPLAFRFNHIVGDSAVMQAVYDRVERAAATDATVLLRGETGTGKERIARAVHYNSRRREAPFVTVDCAALPAGLLENELFGHERGAFTGADGVAEGKVAEANGGTLFLDEIGELPLEVQGKLLRLVQERSYHRVGGRQARTVDVRFVAATHCPLEELVRAGRFRSDLYYRLRVVEIGLPPLRDRGHGDVDRLVDHFLFAHGERHGRPGITITADARAALHAHPWPGNVRELENTLESAVVLAPGPRITRAELTLRTPDDQLDGGFHTGVRTLAEVEAAYVAWVVERCEGNRSAAAKLLDISRNTLARKL